MANINYIKLNRAFTSIAREKRLKPRAKALWIEILEIINTHAKGKQWPDGFTEITEDQLCSSANLTRPTMRAAREELIKAGCIEFNGKERKKYPCGYRIRYDGIFTVASQPDNNSSEKEFFSDGDSAEKKMFSDGDSAEKDFFPPEKRVFSPEKESLQNTENLPITEINKEETYIETVFDNGGGGGINSDIDQQPPPIANEDDSSLTELFELAVSAGFDDTTFCKKELDSLIKEHGFSLVREGVNRCGTMGKEKCNLNYMKKMLEGVKKDGGWNKTKPQPYSQERREPKQSAATNYDQRSYEDKKHDMPDWLKEQLEAERETEQENP